MSTSLPGNFWTPRLHCAFTTSHIRCASPCNGFNTHALECLVCTVTQPMLRQCECHQCSVPCFINGCRYLSLQGRFWGDSFGDLGLPASSAAKFEFEDGYSRVTPSTYLYKLYLVENVQKSSTEQWTKMCIRPVLSGECATHVMFYG